MLQNIEAQDEKLRQQSLEKLEAIKIKREREQEEQAIRKVEFSEKMQITELKKRDVIESNILRKDESVKVIKQ